MNLPYLSLLVFIPLLGAIVILFVPKDREQLIKSLGAIFTFIPMILVALVWVGFEAAKRGFQFVEKLDWVPSLGISYFLGTDGVSLSLLALSALVFFLAAIASWSTPKRLKDYFVLLLLLEVGVLGVFVALDFILFFVFWELMLVPMYFLIGIWGGPRREYAAIKFFIYTLVGSVILLIGILALYFKTGATTFNMVKLAEMAQSLPPNWQWWIFLAMFFGFAVKVPVVPLHTWLPDAHVEAPTPISMILAGILLKTGTYAFVRISHFVLPEAAKSFALVMAVLGVINIVYGALVAMAQRDMKSLVAYSSISHMGFVLLGLAAATPTAVNGAIYQMISHGLISPMFFFMVGVFYERTHTRMIPELGGLYLTAPVAATFLTYTAFANLGLPGLSGFIAEFFTLAGTFGVFTTFVFLAGAGIIVVAAFNLWLMQRVLLGPERSELSHIPDMTPREQFVMVPMMIGVLVLGILPSILLNLYNTPVMDFVARLG